MTQPLHVGKGGTGFALPLDLVTMTQAILARKRSGKSYTASVEAEELLVHGQQIVVFDPTSAWHGLRSSADGDSAGYSIVVFGGDHADAPLDFRTGRAMAAAVREHGFSAIFDIGNLHTEEQVQFVMDFCSELLRINRSPLHVFMDEADTFAPQKPLGLLQNKCLGTVSRLVKQGGIRGIGFTMITQRPASMNKDVLSQVDILTVLRMSHPLDVKAATDWIASEVSVDFANQVKAALPSLPVGTAFFCSASLNLGERVEVRTRKTFNSGATPKPGELRIEPKVIATVDIQKLGQEISESVERVRQESPEYLKKRIAELEEKLAKGGVTDMGLSEDIQRMEQELEELRPLRTKVSILSALADERNLALMVFASDLEDLIVRMKRAVTAQGKVCMSMSPPEVQNSPVTPTVVPPAPAPRASVPPGDAQINDPQQRILNTMATLYSLRNANVTIEWIACTAGTTARARGFEENIRQLRNKGLVAGTSLTPEGAAVAVADLTPATFDAVLGRLGAMLPVPQTNILRHLKGNRLSPDDLAAACETTARARGFEENTRQLRKRDLITYGGGVYKLVDWLEVMR